jgi:DNA-binding CsgD family transcriptional regulator
LLEAARSAVHGEPQSATDLAAAASDTTSDPIVRAHAHRIMAARWNTGGDVRRAVAMLRTDAERVRLLDPKLSVTLLLEAAGPALHAADRALAEDVAEQALAQSVALDEELEFAARVTRGWVDLCWGDVDPALPFGVPWDELVAAVPHGPGVLPNVVATLPWLDMDAQARVVIERLQARGRDLRDPSTLPFALAAGSELDYRAGRWPAGIAAATEAAGLATELGDHNIRARCLINLAWFDAAMGHERECRARVAEAIDIAQRSGAAALQTFGTAATGLLAMTLGDYEAAASDLRRVQRGLAEQGVVHPGIVSWAEDLAEALHRCGRVDAAHEVLDTHAVRVSRARYRPGEMAILRARLAMRHDGPEIEKAIASVAATMASTVPFEYARYLLTYGEWLHLRDRRTAARTPLQEAHSLLARLGAAPWAERARAGLRAAGGKVDRRPEPPALSSLTPQEIRVARAAANGQRNREIAASLFLSTKTVESYLSSVYRKLAIRSRSQLVTVLVENGAL